MQVKCFLCFSMQPSLVLSSTVFLLLLCCSPELSLSYFHQVIVVYLLFLWGNEYGELLAFHLAYITAKMLQDEEIILKAAR